MGDICAPPLSGIYILLLHYLSIFVTIWLYIFFTYIFIWAVEDGLPPCLSEIYIPSAWHPFKAWFMATISLIQRWNQIYHKNMLQPTLGSEQNLFWSRRKTENGILRIPEFQTDKIWILVLFFFGPNLQKLSSLLKPYGSRTHVVYPEQWSGGRTNK